MLSTTAWRDPGTARPPAGKETAGGEELDSIARLLARAADESSNGERPTLFSEDGHCRLVRRPRARTGQSNPGDIARRLPPKPLRAVGGHRSPRSHKNVADAFFCVP